MILQYSLTHKLTPLKRHNKTENPRGSMQTQPSCLLLAVPFTSQQFVVRPTGFHLYSLPVFIEPFFFMYRAISPPIFGRSPSSPPKARKRFPLCARRILFLTFHPGLHQACHQNCLLVQFIFCVDIFQRTPRQRESLTAQVATRTVRVPTPCMHYIFRSRLPNCLAHFGARKKATTRGEKC